MGQVQSEDRVARMNHRHVGGSIGLRAGVRLHIGVLGAKELLGAVARQIFDDVGVFATAVIALARIALGIFVGEDRSGRLEHGLADEIFRGDHLQAFMLAANLMVDGGGDLRIGLGERAAHIVRHRAILDMLFGKKCEFAIRAPAKFLPATVAAEPSPGLV